MNLFFKNKKSNVKVDEELILELISSLGGKDNIINAEYNMSRFKVILKDITLVNKEGITALGAKGIVEIDNTLKIIFGKDAKQLKKYITDMM